MDVEMGVKRDGYKREMDIEMDGYGERGEEREGQREICRYI